MSPARDTPVPGPGPSMPRTRVIIQIERPGVRLCMEDVSELFRGTGIELDASYGPILVNPGLGRFVVRGLADPPARERAEAIPGVRLFADARIEPAPPEPPD